MNRYAVFYTFVCTELKIGFDTALLICRFKPLKIDTGFEPNT